MVMEPYAKDLVFNHRQQKQVFVGIVSRVSPTDWKERL